MKVINFIISVFRAIYMGIKLIAVFVYDLAVYFTKADKLAHVTVGFLKIRGGTFDFYDLVAGFIGFWISVTLNNLIGYAN